MVTPIACALLLLPLGPGGALPAHADSAFAVNSLADTDDGRCDTSHCTLREAINAANASTDLSTVSLAGLSGSIRGDRDLPSITAPITLSGPRSPATVEITRGNAVTTRAALLLEAGAAGSTIDHFTINRFSSAIETRAPRTTIKNSSIGTSTDERAIIGNWGTGIRVLANNAFIYYNNVIGGNSTGIQLSASDGRVEENWIGLGRTPYSSPSSGVYLPNSYDGIVVHGSRNIIWWSMIANNGADGVRIESGTGNRLEHNAIFANQGLGINLGTDQVTANDGVGDGDSGPNGLQNFPSLRANYARGATAVDVILMSAGTQSFVVELYSSDRCDASSYGEGRDWVMTIGGPGSTNLALTTNPQGYGSTTVSSTSPLLAVGKWVTATARNLNTNDTSEFSFCEQVQVASSW